MGKGQQALQQLCELSRNGKLQTLPAFHSYFLVLCLERQDEGEGGRAELG